MTVVLMNADRTTWVQINTVAQRIQVFGGRLQIAESNAPAANDWHIWLPGQVVDVTAVKWARAHDPIDTEHPVPYVVTQPI